MVGPAGRWVSNPVILGCERVGVHDHVNRMGLYQQCWDSGHANILKVSNSMGGKEEGEGQ